MEGDVGILEEKGSVGFGIVIEIGGIGLVAADVLGGEHAFIFLFIGLGTRLILHLCNEIKLNKLIWFGYCH